MEERILNAAKKECDLVVFPELMVCGYIKDEDPKFKLEYWEKGAEEVPGLSTEKIGKVAAETGCYVIFGLAVRSRVPVGMYNSSILIGPEGVIGVTHKIHVPRTEKYYFNNGWEPSVYKTPLGRIGMMVCYDAIFPESMRILALKGAEIVSCIFNAPQFTLIRFQYYPLLPLMNQAHLILCSGVGDVQLGATKTWHMVGHSRIINAKGQIVVASDTDKEEIVRGELTDSDLKETRAFLAQLGDRVPTAYGCLVKGWKEIEEDK
jgi:predicted amidohydrolase